MKEMHKQRQEGEEEGEEEDKEEDKEEEVKRGKKRKGAEITIVMTTTLCVSSLTLKATHARISFSPFPLPPLSPLSPAPS